jgi:hypothetical protein
VAGQGFLDVFFKLLNTYSELALLPSMTKRPLNGWMILKTLTSLENYGCDFA